MMNPKPTFVLAGKLDPAFLSEVAEGTRPALEFVRFAERNGISLISADRAPGLPGWMRGVGAKLAKIKVPLARWVAAHAEEYSAIITSGEDIGIPLALALAARRSAVPLLIQVHGHSLEGRKFRLVAPILKRMRSVHMLCLSASLREMLVTTYGFSPERCHTVGFGVDTNFFAPMPAKPAVDDRPLIVAAGMANRDYPTLFQAVRDMPIRVWIAADSPWAKDVAGPEMGTVPDNVEFRSAGTYQGLRDLYAESLCVVVPMHPAVHACGYAVMAEAMAMGRPVIASRLETPCDFFEDGVHGAYVPTQDASALWAALSEMVLHPEMAEAQGRAARQRMEQGFTLDDFCARIERCIPA